MIVLASGSKTRADMLARAGVTFEAVPPRVDEESLRASMLEEHPRDIADALAEMKARKVAQRMGSGMVLGSDQVLAFEGGLVSKAATQAELREQLSRLSGQTHELLSAAVIYEDAKPVWRFVGRAKLHMRPLSQDFIEDYVRDNWDEVQYSVGGYLIEGEGVRLFSRLEGDHFSILGMPLLEVLNYLATRGVIDT